MSIIKSIIIDEYKRSMQMLETYREELKGLPRGAICKKTIKGKDYYYWVYRENGKVINKYISSKCNDIEKLRIQVEKRKRTQKLIKEIEKEVDDMKKYLRKKEK